MTITSTDVARAKEHVQETIGPPDAWPKWQGGWPGEISTALIDAVYSARATYFNWDDTGVHGQVARWRKSPRRKRLFLEDLVAEMKPSTNRWMVKCGFAGVSPGRPRSAAIGNSKAATVHEAAQALIHGGISTASDINVANVTDVSRILRAVPGIGRETANRFLLLLDAPVTRADRSVSRFLARAVGHATSSTDADALVAKVAGRLSVDACALNRAIWGYESLRARMWESIRVIGVDAATVAFGSASVLGPDFELDFEKTGGDIPPPTDTLVCLNTMMDLDVPVEVLRLPNGTPFAARMFCVRDGDVLEGKWSRTGELVLADGLCLACDPWCTPNSYYHFEFQMAAGRYVADKFLYDGEELGLRIRLLSDPGQ